MSDNKAQKTQRPATPDDPPCSCGLSARVIYISNRFGEVSSCLDRNRHLDRLSREGWRP